MSILKIIILLAVFLIGPIFVNTNTIKQGGCVQATCMDNFTKNITDHIPCHKCSECLRENFKEHKSFCIRSWDIFDGIIYHDDEKLVLNETNLWHQETDSCICTNFFPSDCYINQKLELNVAEYNRKTLGLHEERTHEDWSPKIACYMPNTKLPIPELYEDSIKNSIGSLDTREFFDDYYYRFSWKRVELKNLVLNYDVYTNNSRCPINVLKNTSDRYASNFTNKCFNWTKIQNINDIEQDLIKFSFCDVNKLWYTASIYRPKQLDFSHDHDEMIVNGSIEISSNVKIYEIDQNLCCKQEEERLLEEYKNFVENEAYNETDYEMVNISLAKWDAYQGKRYECFEINEPIRPDLKPPSILSEAKDFLVHLLFKTSPLVTILTISLIAVMVIILIYVMIRQFCQFLFVEQSAVAMRRNTSIRVNSNRHSRLSVYSNKSVKSNRRRSIADEVEALYQQQLMTDD